MTDNELEQKIKNALIEETKNINVNENTFNEIYKKIHNEGKNLKMKKSFVKPVIVFAVIFIFTTTACIAAMSKVKSYHSSSSHNDDIYEFPTASVLEEKAGFVPKYVEDTIDGFSFENVGFSDHTANDESDNIIEEYKGIMFVYKSNTNTDRFTVHANKVSYELFQQGIDEQSEKENYNGIYLYYTEVNSIFFPPDVEGKELNELLTPQQLEDYENGKLNVAYGSDKIEESSGKFVIWYDNGIEYSIFASDTSLEKDNLISAAKNIINQ